VIDAWRNGDVSRRQGYPANAMTSRETCTYWPHRAVGDANALAAGPLPEVQSTTS
jgi:hypothetical protein